jgi:uncharacterized protein (TIGR03083 family)
MSRIAVPALTAETGHVTALLTTLSAKEWAAPSGCDGWRVQDVVAHMAAVFRSVCGDTSIPADPNGDAEASAELALAPRKAWTPAEVAAEYREWAPQGVAALTALQEPPLADTVIPLGNLGSHPMHVLGNAIVFDHYCHLRHDIGAAVARAADLPRDEAALAATLEWMLMGLPQMCASALAGAPRQAVVLEFTGPAAATFTLAPGEGDGPWTVTAGESGSGPVCRTSVHDFVSWGTKRSDWRESAGLDGGEAAARADAEVVLDAVNVI